MIKDSRPASPARPGAPPPADQLTEALEALASTAYDDGAVSEVIRPAAIVPENAARTILAELAMRDVRQDGHWLTDPACWRRFDIPFTGPLGDPGDAQLLGTIQLIYGTPTRYEITIYRASVTRHGAASGWSISALCDEALSYGALSLATCPRASLRPPPKAFRLNGA
jgi:hypothetical protein